MKVKSSNIDEIAWEDDELFVTFLSSDVTYVYPGVTKETYEEVLTSPSIGSAFHHLVKKVVDPQFVRKE